MAPQQRLGRRQQFGFGALAIERAGVAKQRLLQVVLNVLRNALNYAASSDRIEVRLTQEQAAADTAAQAGALLVAVLAGLGNCTFHPVDFTILNQRVSAPRLGHAFSAQRARAGPGGRGAPPPPPSGSPSRRPA